MASYIYGIDFGTSNSVLAATDTTTRKIVKVISQSSLIYFENAQKVFIGNEAINQYLQNNMKGRLLKSVKTLLPQSNFTFTYIYGKKYTAEELVTLILKFLKQEADTALGQDVKEVVLGRPVVFSEDREKDALAQKRLLNAARMAGFEKIVFQYEPIAAGFLYEQSIDQPETVLIGDFGGGTSDFTLMKLNKENQRNKDRKSDILRTGGIHIGGDDFDAQIMWHKLVSYFGYGLKYESYGKMLDLPVHIFRTLCEWEQMGFLKEGSIRKSLDSYYLQTKRDPAIQRLMSFIDHNLGFSLFQVIEKSKIELSEKNETQLTFDFESIEIKEHFPIAEFNGFINKEIQQIESFLTTFMDQSNIQTDSVNNVFLTGGTSSIPAVTDIFKKKFGDEKIHKGDNFNSVAQGLALSYFYLNE